MISDHPADEPRVRPTRLRSSAPWFLLLALIVASLLAGLGMREPSPPDEPRFVLAARQMVVQTILGAARMLAEGGQSAGALRQAVTSPNGTTQAALETLADGGFHELVGNAVAAAAQRGRELAGAG